MTAKEMRDSVRDLAFVVRRVTPWARRAHPAPESEELFHAVEKRLEAVEARLGAEE
jgi:hypothetical protein